MKTILCSRPGRLLVLVTVLATFLTSCSKEAAPQYLVGTGGVQGNYQTVGLTLARITNQSQLEPSFLLKTVSSSGSVANINAISTGDHQFGIAQADHQHQAVKGLGDWSEKGPQKELRTIFNIFVESVTLVAGADSGIKSIGDLRRKTVDIGAVGRIWSGQDPSVDG